MKYMKPNSLIFLLFLLFQSIDSMANFNISSSTDSLERIIFIHGFGENAHIFDKIAPHLPAKEKIFVDNWAALGNEKKADLNVLVYAQELVNQYHITERDVIIGHSMGGWIAYHIKHLTGCKIVQIASWTNQKKVIMPIKNRKMVYLLTKMGLVFNYFTQKYVVHRHYKGKDSEYILTDTVKRLRKGDKDNVNNQLRVVLALVNQQISVTPDMRFHAKADTIVRCPDEAYIEVPGDHFTLYTQPEAIYLPILQWFSTF